MKILFINTFDNSGGAAIVAYRLHQDLFLEYKTENYFVVGSKRTKDSNVFSTKRNIFEKIIEILINRLFNFLGFQYYYIPISAKRLIKYIKQIKPDVINIHNIHGGFFETGLLNKIACEAPIVWTLHDMWSFTGHCGYSYDCEKWKSGCGKCSYKDEYPNIGFDRTKALWKKKKELYTDLELNIITPSKWLASCIKESPLLKKNNIKVINNGIDISVFKPKDKSKAKKQFGISEDQKTIMICAENANSIRKGFYLLIDILKILDKINKNLHLLTIGNGSIHLLENLKNIKIHNLGKINKISRLVDCYNAADLLLFPTLADNLPNVLVESISCGTPCVSFDVGGCKEIIQEKKTGVLVTPFNIDKFAAKTNELLKDKNQLNELSITSRAFAEKYFSIKKMSKEYYSLFQDLLQK